MANTATITDHTETQISQATGILARGLANRRLANRQRQRLVVALAGVLAMLASILVLVAPAASPASAQSRYDSVVIRIYDFNDDEYHTDLCDDCHQDDLGQVSSRSVPSGVLTSYTITPTAASHEDCTDETSYVFRTDGTSRTENSTPFYLAEADIDARRSTAPVRVPSVGTNACVYDVVFHPVYHAGSDGWYGPHRKIRNNAGNRFIADLVIDADDQGEQHEFDKGFATAYEQILTFQPDITIDLPPDLVIGSFDHTSLEDETIEVDYERASGNSVGNCGGSTDKLVLTIGSNGVASLPPASESVLWDQPSGERSSCAYTLTFPNTAAGGKLVKTASPNEDRATSNADAPARAARAVYERAEVTFDLNIVFQGLSSLQGESFDVTVTPVGAGSDGSHATCTDRFTVSVEWDSGSSEHSGEQTGVVDYPRGASMASQICEYNIAWPDDPSGFEGTPGAMRIDGSDATAGVVTETATYRGSTDYGEIFVQLWNFNNSGGGLGTEGLMKDPNRENPAMVDLRYRVTPRAQGDPGGPYPASGCTEAAIYSQTTQSDESRVEEGDHDGVFVKRPLRASHDCVYDVEWLPSYHAGSSSWYSCGITRTNIEIDTVIDSTPHPEDSRSAIVGSCEKILHFQPTVDLTLPPDIIPGRPDTTIVGETVELAYARASGNTVANCGGVPAGGLVATIGAGGAVSLPGADVAALWDQPVGERDSCEYTLTFPDDNGGKLAKVASTNEDTETSNADKDASSAYERVQGTFDLNLEAEGLSSGATYTAMVRAAGADAQTGAHATCSDSFPVTLTWDAGESKHTGSEADVIDYPRGAEAASDVCEYRIAWPQGQDAVGFALDSAHTSADGTQGSTPSSATYTRLPGTFFDATITIEVPQIDRPGMSDNNFYHADDATRTFILVDIARSGGPTSGCSALTGVRFQIGQTGTVTPVDGTISLIDVPDQETASCEYAVTFRSVASAAGVSPPWTLSLDQSTRVPTLSPSNRMISVRYLEAASNFTPTVDITLPDRDGAATGQDLFAGAAFVVGFTPVSGSNADCTGAVSYTYTVGTDGALTPSPAVRELVDVLLGQAARCEYDVSVGPASVDSAAGAAFTWSLDQDSSPAPTSMVSKGSEAVTASYSLDGDTTFTLAPDVTVPDYNSDDNPASHAFAGEQVSVGVARTGGPSSDCSAASTITWTIGADGSLSTTDSLALVDYPDGETTRCVYGLTWSANEVGAGTPAKLGLHTGASTSASGTARAIAAEYRAPTSNFMPSVSGSVELVDEDGDEVHDLSGVTLEVGYDAAEGADSGCSGSGTAPGVSEVYVVGDDGMLSLDASSAAVTLVDRPTGVNARCAYNLTYPEAAVAAADPAAPAGTEPVSVPVARGTLEQLTAADELVLNYATPPPPPAIVRPVPLMSANRGVERLPVRVALDVPSGVFAAVDTFEVLVWAPGACGSDTFLFGGVPASAGVAYAAAASDTGQVVVLGEGASQQNRRAVYSLPPYVDGDGSSTADSSGREACAVRVSVLNVPQGCSMVGAAGVDGQGRAYIEAAWSQGSAGFDLTASFDCPDLSVGDPTSQGSVSLVQGWVTLSFNGPSGTTPREFAQLLDGAVNSMWVWDAVAQGWRGWTQQHGVVGLPTLTRGQTVMAYVPSAVEVNYSPADLLAPPAPTGSLRLSPGYNLHTFNGDSPARMDALLREPWPITVVFLWHSATQSWRYYLPEIGPIAGLGIEWFSTIRPGDTVLMHSRAFGNVTYPWV